MTTPDEVTDLRNSVEDLRSGVNALSARVGDLSSALQEVNDLQREQQRIGDRATRAIEEAIEQANRLATKVDDVEAESVTHAEHEGRLWILAIKRRIYRRRVIASIIAGLYLAYCAIFIALPYEQQECVVRGPATDAAQHVCNVVSPFEKHPIGGRNLNAIVSREDRKLLHDQISVLMSNEQALNQARAAQGLPPLSLAPDPALVEKIDSVPADESYDFGSLPAVGFDLVATFLLVGGLTYGIRREIADKGEIRRVEGDS